MMNYNDMSSDKETKQKLIEQEENSYIWVKTPTAGESLTIHYQTLGDLIDNLSLSKNAIFIISSLALVPMAFLTGFQRIESANTNGIFCIGTYKERYIYCNPLPNICDINILDNEITYKIFFEENV